MTDRITQTLQAKIAARAIKGLREYGTTLADAPLSVREVLVHAQEEALDQAAYLQWLIDRMDAEGGFW
jgi:hypothetical protein